MALRTVTYSVDFDALEKAAPRVLSKMLHKINNMPNEEAVNYLTSRGNYYSSLDLEAGGPFLRASCNFKCLPNQLGSNPYAENYFAEDLANLLLQVAPDSKPLFEKHLATRLQNAICRFINPDNDKFLNILEKETN